MWFVRSADAMARVPATPKQQFANRRVCSASGWVLDAAGSEVADGEAGRAAAAVAATDTPEDDSDFDSDLTVGVGVRDVADAPDPAAAEDELLVLVVGIAVSAAHKA